MQTGAAFRSQAFEIKEVGVVKDVKRGIVKIEGFPSCVYGQLVEFAESGLKGLVIDFDEQQVMAFVFGDEKRVRLGSAVASHRDIFTIPVGEGYIGRVVNSIAQPIDDRNMPIAVAEEGAVFRRAPGVLDRIPISQQLYTGIKIIDTIIPVGKGQRELIVGDRQTGKTALALDAILNQRGKNVVCIYCWIGGAHTTLGKIARELKEHGAMDYSLVVAASASASAGEQYLAPYVAAAIGEYFMYRGRDVLVVFDDLTKHAWIYRELSLLLERSPGREAYPGDIFYIHSQLMERAARLNEELGSGSMTFLPIAETLQGDITGCVQSNLVSMTDGQIYVSSGLFHEGFKPAIDLGLSVSRIGSKVQSEAIREVTESLRLDYAQYKELLRLMRIRTKLSTEVAERLRRGETLTQLLIQDARQPLDEVTMVVQFYAFRRKILEILSGEGLAVFCHEIMEHLRITRPQLLKEIDEKKQLTPEIRAELDKAFVEFFRERKIV
ncbi:MAG: F0F1 ATP synthase subunit alpha [Deltaproteobacteria bacterium]